MNSTGLIYASYIVFTICVVSIVVCLIYDFNRARQIRKRLREDYGDECCRLLRIDEAISETAGHSNESSVETQEKVVSS